MYWMLDGIKPLIWKWCVESKSSWLAVRRHGSKSEWYFGCGNGYVTGKIKSHKETKTWVCVCVCVCVFTPQSALGLSWDSRSSPYGKSSAHLTNLWVGPRPLTHNTPGQRGHNSLPNIPYLLTARWTGATRETHPNYLRPPRESNPGPLGWRACGHILQLLSTNITINLLKRSASKTRIKRIKTDKH